MAIEVRRNGAWVDNTQEKKRVNGAWVSNSPYKVMKPTISGIPPLKFNSAGEPLIDWGMLGQGVQASTPTQQNPVMFDGVGERTGNFFNVSDYSVGGTSFITKRITLEPNTAYTMSSDCPLYNVGALIAIGNVGESFTTAKNGVYPNHSITRTTDANGELVIGLRTNGSDYSPADYKTMLNTGSSPLPYEPYGVKIPITCGGQTTNIYLGSATSTRRIKKLVLTGEETGWTLYQLPSGGTVGIYQFYINENIISGVANSSCRCTITPYGISSQNRGNYLYGAYLVSSGRSVALQMKGSEADFPTVDAFKTFLQQQYANGTPVTIWYILATPETAATNEPLMKIGDYADEITKTGTGVDIPTVSGSNTLTVGTTVQPSEMTIESISQWV